MTFLESVTPDYIIVCLLSLAAVIFVMMRILQSENDENQSDDDSGGEDLPDFPLLDLPTGVVTLEEYEREKRRQLEDTYA